jgi:predicted DNA-binding transcriptional regulator YafY
VSKLERLLNLTAALLETPRPLTVEEIRELIPGYPDNEASFRRSFERDKDDLREMGVPIEVVAVPATDPPQQGYSISPQAYYLRDPGLEADELAALRLAARAVRLDDDGGGTDVDRFRKLGGVDAKAGESATLASIPTTPDLEELFRATLERRIVSFDYGSERRRTRPYRLDFQRGRWYLTAFDETRDGERHFRLDRIDGAVEVDPTAHFERPEHTPGLRVDPWQLGEGEAVEAVVRFDADQVTQAKAQLGDDTRWKPAEDGSAVATIPVTNRDGFRSFVLGFLDHAEVLGPPDLRSEIVAWLEALAA